MVPPTRSTTGSTSHNVPSSSSRSVALKRDSLAAELERDPELSTAKRKQRTQAFASNLAHASLERQLAAAQSTRIEIEAKLREKDITVERLENDRRWFADRENEERQEKERERREHEDEKRQAEAELRQLKSILTNLREQHAELQDAHSDLVRTSSQNLGKLNTQIATLSKQVSAITQELSDCKSIAEDRHIRCEELEEQLETLRSGQAPSEFSPAAEADMNLIRNELHSQAGYMAKLEATNMKLEAQLSVLRDQHASIEVLREEKRALEKRARMNDEAYEYAVRLEAEIEAGKREREQWQRLLSESTAPSNTPVSLAQTLSALQLEHTHLLEEHGANVVAFRQSEVQRKVEEQRAAEADKLNGQLEQDVNVLEGRVRKREQRISLLEREVGFLKALMVSYTAENVHNQDAEQIDESQDQRLRELESLLSQYKSTNDALIQELDEIRDREPSMVAEPTVEHEQKYLDRIEDLEQKIFELGGEIGAGRHVPPGVRVLCMKDNPEQSWVDLRQSVMDQLRGENEALIKRLKELEAATSVDAGQVGHRGVALVPRESWELVTKEKAEVEEALKQKEKRLLRLQQVFTSKSQEFREAIASILGVKLAFYPNGQVRVTSIFDLSASFVFQPTLTSMGESGRMQLIAQGEGGPPEIPQLMQHWIEQEQCIPGFLAGVTMDCYDRASREGKLPPGFEM